MGNLRYLMILQNPLPWLRHNTCRWEWKPSFDLYVDPRDGKGYLLLTGVHTEVVIADLTDDYMDVTGNYSSHFPMPHSTL